jgi:hypothetical protein
MGEEPGQEGQRSGVACWLVARAHLSARKPAVICRISRLGPHREAVGSVAALRGDEEVHTSRHALARKLGSTAGGNRQGEGVQEGEQSQKPTPPSSHRNRSQGGSSHTAGARIRFPRAPADPLAGDAEHAQRIGLVREAGLGGVGAGHVGAGEGVAPAGCWEGGRVKRGKRGADWPRFGLALRSKCKMPSPPVQARTRA